MDVKTQWATICLHAVHDIMGFIKVFSLATVDEIHPYPTALLIRFTLPDTSVIIPVPSECAANLSPTSCYSLRENHYPTVLFFIRLTVPSTLESSIVAVLSACAVNFGPTLLLIYTLVAHC